LATRTYPKRFQRARAHHRLQFADHLLHSERLAEEATIDRPFGVRRRHLPRNQYDLDGGPAVVHRMGQLEAVHAAGHLNIGEQQRYVRAGFENGDSLIGVDGLDRAEAGILDDVDGTHAQHHLILNNQDVGHLGRIG
jgi:hypothetical protein